MLAMSDAEFAQMLGQIAGDVKRGTVKARQQEAAQAMQTVSTGVSSAASAMGGAKDGGVVPGEGNEDTVAAKLTPGEIVIPKELSAQLMEVISRSVGEDRGAARANTGGMVRRDPSTGYLTQEPDAGDYMRRMAETSPGQKVMARFGGDMAQMSEWYDGQKKKPRDWGEALKILSAGGK
jgi:guanyl-specific ribonuclease Sa